MTWMPYTEAVLEHLPAICTLGRDIWRAAVPLICFETVEMHLPDRVMRQFGLEQLVPDPCDTVDELHSIDRRGNNRQWQTMHQVHIEEWDRRLQRVVPGLPYTGVHIRAYILWYLDITRRIISPATLRRPTDHYQPASTDFILLQGLQGVQQRYAEAEEIVRTMELSEALREFSLSTIQSMREDMSNFEQLNAYYTPSPHDPTMEHISAAGPSQTLRRPGRRLRRRRDTQGSSVPTSAPPQDMPQSQCQSSHYSYFEVGESSSQPSPPLRPRHHVPLPRTRLSDVHEVDYEEEEEDTRFD